MSTLSVETQVLFGNDTGFIFLNLSKAVSDYIRMCDPFIWIKFLL